VHVRADHGTILSGICARLVSMTDPMTDQTWNTLLREQLTWHWDHQLRDRLDGLGDDEYFWEPVPGCWNVRPRGTGTAPVQAGSGAMTIDFAMSQPDPHPVTTIAWRLGHVIVGVLAMRNAAHFGRAPTDYQSFDYAATGPEALAQLDAEYATWLAGVESLGDAGLARPCGEAEGPYGDRPLAALVLHIHRELIHHLAEVCLLRDLHLHMHDRTRRKAS
jgi:DinB superfamily